MGRSQSLPLHHLRNDNSSEGYIGSVHMHMPILFYDMREQMKGCGLQGRTNLRYGWVKIPSLGCRKGEIGQYRRSRVASRP